MIGVACIEYGGILDQLANFKNNIENKINSENVKLN